jgi:hypothetical protein
MTLAAILEQAGFVPTVPKSSQTMGTPESKVQSHVPTVPIVPTQKHEGETETAAIRARLLILAAADVLDADLVHALPEVDVLDCAGLPDETLRATLRGFRDDDLRERGKCPADETAPVLCPHCGPVWFAPEVAAVLPVVWGWPRVLGCPWCHVRNRQAIPRPSVACGECQHFERAAINPDGGMGRCMAGREPLPRESLPFPHAARQCAQFKPEGNR